MKIAIPVVNGKLSAHFGHCEHFAIVSIDPDSKQILSNETAIPPTHEPGSLPRWLNEIGASAIIAGGMGMRAQEFFTQYGIEVLIGAQSDTPETLVTAYLDGKLSLGSNLCDH